MPPAPKPVASANSANARQAATCCLLIARPAFILSVVGILNLQPVIPVVLDARLSFRDDPFQITCTYLLEESLTTAFNMLHVQQSRTFTRLDQLLESVFSDDEWQPAQVAQVVPI